MESFESNQDSVTSRYNFLTKKGVKRGLTLMLLLTISHIIYIVFSKISENNFNLFFEKAVNKSL